MNERILVKLKEILYDSFSKFKQREFLNGNARILVRFIKQNGLCIKKREQSRFLEIYVK